MWTKNRSHSSVYVSRPCLVGYALSPGSETYATGWHSLCSYSLWLNLLPKLSPPR